MAAFFDCGIVSSYNGFRCRRWIPDLVCRGASLVQKPFCSYSYLAGPTLRIRLGLDSKQDLFGRSSPGKESVG
jgi:hypothetical protein